MSSFGPASTTVRRLATDPSKHVNYVLEMVLGADDLIQEFTYLSERDRRLVRDLLGFGTAWGLGVTGAQGTQGVEVQVSPGVAVSPRGQLIRVTAAQGAPLNGWLATHGAEVDAYKRQGPAPDNATLLSLYVTLRYREELTDAVPLPGGPCRTEDDVTVPSRILDDYKLELRLEPPRQLEEDALRDFTRWLRKQLQPVSTGGASLGSVLNAIRAAVVEPVPPAAPKDYLNEASPPTPIPVPADKLAQYLRAAFRLWVTELRARWRPAFQEVAPDSMAPSSSESLHAEDGVLLATLELKLTRTANSGPWQVASLQALTIDEESRPCLVPLRLLQEWLLTAAPAPSAGAAGLAALAPQPSSPLPSYQVSAAGLIPADPTSKPRSYNQLRATRVEPGRVAFTFDGFTPPTQESQYVVKAMLAAPQGLKAPCITLGAMDDKGFTLEVSDQGKPVKQSVLTGLRFVIEVSHLQLPPG